MLRPKNISKPNVDNKENTPTDSQEEFSSLQSLNYKMSNKSVNDVRHNPHDERIRALMDHKDQIQKTLHIEREKSKQEIALVMKRNMGLEDSVRILEKEKIENEEEIQYLRQKLAGCEDKVSNLKITLGDHVKKIEGLSKELERRQNSRNEKSNNETIELLQKIKGLQEEMRMLEESKKQRDEQKLDLENENRNSQQKIKEIERERKRFMNELEILNKEVTNLRKCEESILQELQKSTKISDNLTKEKNLLKQELDVLQSRQNQQISQLEDRLSSANQDRDEKLNRISQLQTRIQSYEQKMVMQSQLILLKEVQIKELKQKNMEIENNMQMQLRSQKQSKLVELQYEIQHLTKTVANKEEIIKELNQSVARWQSQCKKISESRDQFEGELLTYKVKIQRSEEQQKQIEKMKRNYEGMIDKMNMDRRESENKQRIVYEQKMDSLIIELANAEENLKNWKIESEKKMHQIDKNVAEYESIIKSETRRGNELEQLISCLKQKLQLEKDAYKDEERRLNSKVVELSQKNNELTSEAKSLREELYGVKSSCEGSLSQMKMLKETSISKQKQLERRMRIVSQQKQYLEIEVKKWKEYRTESNAEFDDLRKEHRKMKQNLEEKEETIMKLKNKTSSINELEFKCNQLQQERASTVQRYEQEIKRYENRIEQMVQSNYLQEQKNSQKMVQELEIVGDELARTKRKLEESLFTLSRFEKKNEEQTLLIEELRKLSKEDLERVSKDAEKKQKEVISLSEDAQALKKQNMVYQGEMQDLMLKFGEKDRKIDELTEKIKRMESINSRFEEQISEKDKINKEKSALQQEKARTDKSMNRLSLENSELKQEILSVRAFVKQYQEQIEEYQNEAKENKMEIEKYIQKLTISETKLKQLKVGVEKREKCEQKRQQYYHKLCQVSSQQLGLLQTGTELQFLHLLHEKLASHLVFVERLKIERHQFETKLIAQAQAFRNTKNMEEQQKFRQSYDIVYKKYMKYKDAFLLCKKKLEEQRIGIIQDQRFTEEILKTCQTFVYKKD